MNLHHTLFTYGENTSLSAQNV